MEKLHKISIILLICLFPIISQAKEVNKKTAEKAASKVLAELTDNKRGGEFQVKEILTVKSEEKTCFYIVNSPAPLDIT